MFRGKTALPTAERLERDLNFLKHELGADAIQFYDHNFFDREIDMVPLLEVMARIQLPWWCYARSDALLNLSDRSWALVRKSRLRMAYIGAESPSDWLLHDVRKGTKSDQTLAAVENVFPPVPADVSVALGAFLAGRGLLDPWIVFLLTWFANTASGALVYLLSRRYGRAFFTGRLGRRLLPEAVLLRVELEYARQGTWGIFVSRLLPVWRGVVMPFAGIANVRATRALLPLAAASAV